MQDLAGSPVEVHCNFSNLEILGVMKKKLEGSPGFSNDIIWIMNKN